MADILDLDVIDPELRKIKVNGKIYEIRPARVNATLKLLKLQKITKGKTNEEMAEMSEEILETLQSIIPNAEEMDLNMAQLTALIAFLLKPTEANNAPTEEKKISESPTQ